MSQTRTLPAEPAVSETELWEAIRRQSVHALATVWDRLLPLERFRAVGLALRERLVATAIRTAERYRQAQAKTVYYLSMEYLIGRSLGNNLINLGLHEPVAAAL